MKRKIEPQQDGDNALVKHQKTSADGHAPSQSADTEDNASPPSDIERSQAVIDRLKIEIAQKQSELQKKEAEHKKMLDVIKLKQEHAKEKAAAKKAALDAAHLAWEQAEQDLLDAADKLARYE